MNISVVIPVYGCRSALPELHRRLTEVLKGLVETYEIILVDDCCPQGSWEEIKRISSNDRCVKGIRLSKNFGQPCAIMAGVERSKGDWVVVMDCDLQDKPEAIVDLYKKAEQGYDVVFARRIDRKDSLIVKQLSKWYHSVLDFFTGTKTDNTIGNFSISKRIVIDNFLRLNEKGRAYQLFIEWVGFNQTYIDVEGDVRFEGKSSYNFRRKLKFALSTITSHSNRPLYVSIGVGALFVLASLIAIICLVVRRLLDSTTQLGWTSIMASIYLVGGLLMLSIGLIGVYIGNIFTEVKNRPIFIVAETTNLDDEVKGTK